MSAFPLISQIRQRKIDWQATKFKAASEVQLGKMLQPKQERPDDTKELYLRAANIAWTGVNLSDVQEMWVSQREKEKYDLRAGDVLVSEGGDVGRASYLKVDLPGIYFQNAINRVRAKCGCEGRFLFYWLQVVKNSGWLEILCNRATIAHFTADKLRETEVILPPLPTQRRIAAYLDRETAGIDALVAQKEALLALLEEKRASLISHAVTRGLNPKAKLKPSGIPWLGDVPEHWSVAQVGHRYHVDLGKMLDAKKISGDYLKPYLRNQDVQWNGINSTDLPQMDIKPDEESRFALIPGDLLVCEGGECGRCSIWTETKECYYQKALHRLRPRTVRDHSGYFRFLMEVAVITGVFASDSNANTIGHLPAEKFRNYRMVFPPVEEQRKIADLIFQQEAYFKGLRHNIQESIHLLREKRASLISAAVTGELAVLEPH